MNKTMEILFNEWSENGIRKYKYETDKKTDEIKNIVGKEVFLTIEELISCIEEYDQREAYEQGFNDAMNLFLNRE